MLERCQLFQSLLYRNIVKEADQDAIAQLIWQQKEYTPTAFLMIFLMSSFPMISIQDLCIYWSYLWCFLLRVAWVQRLFSKIKLIKTRLRNQLGQSSPNSLLHIYTEGQWKFQKYAFFVNELKRLNPKLRMKL